MSVITVEVNIDKELLRKSKALVEATSAANSRKMQRLKRERSPSRDTADMIGACEALDQMCQANILMIDLMLDAKEVRT